MAEKTDKKESKFSFFARLSFLTFATVMTVYALSCVSRKVADLINSTVSQNFRMFMASFGDIFPFSLFEMLMLSLPIVLVIIIFIGIRSFSKGRGVRFLINILAAILFIYSGHTLALGIGYHTTPLSAKMNLTDTEITKERLVEIMTNLRDEVNLLSDTVQRDSNGIFNPGYTFNEISEKISTAHVALAEKYSLPKSFQSTAKGVFASRAMSYLRIGGIYTYITGEANVNTEYPPYDVIFTAAHEMSHQRGILREDEANFMAYLITSTSTDQSLRYSGALNLYSYVASALYRTDSDAYKEVAASLSDGARADIAASNAITQKYGDTIVADISEWINDFYLTSNGTDGTVSYSQVVRLAVSYFESQK